MKFTLKSGILIIGSLLWDKYVLRIQGFKQDANHGK